MDAAKGPTQKLAADLKAVSGALLGALEPASAETPARIGSSANSSADSSAIDSGSVRAQIAEKRAKVEAMRSRAAAAAPQVDATAAGTPTVDTPTIDSPAELAGAAGAAGGTAAAGGVGAASTAGGRRRSQPSVAVDAVVVDAAVAGDAVGSGEANWPPIAEVVEVVASEAAAVEVVAEVASPRERGASFDTMRSAGGPTPPPAASTSRMRDEDSSATGLAASGGPSASQEVVLDAVDVQVTASERDESDVAQERSALVLDTILVNLEVSIGTFVGRTADLLTPEAARSWQLLRAFQRERTDAEVLQQRAQRSREKLLDELARGIDRR